MALNNIECYRSEFHGFDLNERVCYVDFHKSLEYFYKAKKICPNGIVIVVLSYWKKKNLITHYFYFRLPETVYYSILTDQ